MPRLRRGRGRPRNCGRRPTQLHRRERYSREHCALDSDAPVDGTSASPSAPAIHTPTTTGAQQPSSLHAAPIPATDATGTTSFTHASQHVGDPNITAEQLQRLHNYWTEANTLADQPLFDGLCYKCGCLLWSPNHCNTVAKASEDEEAPIISMYGTIPDFLPYEKVARNGTPQWLCCNICKKRRPLPPEYGSPQTGLCSDGVGSRALPTVISNLQSPAERRAIALASLMSTTKTQRSDPRHRWRSIEGMYGLQPKTSRHYYGMFGAIAAAPQFAPTTQGGLNSRVCDALRWLKANNPLYDRFFANYETLFRYHISSRDAFISLNPSPDELDAVITSHLQDEQNALIYPADDLFDVPPITGRDDIVGVQHPGASREAQRHTVRSYYSGMGHNHDTREPCAAVQDCCSVSYFQDNVEERVWPDLFPYGIGGYRKERQGMSLSAYQKHRLLDLDSRFRDDPHWAFVQYDRRCRNALSYYNRQIATKRRNVTAREALEAWGNTQSGGDPTVGDFLPVNVPGSKSYWHTKMEDVLAMSSEFGKPDFFVTLTMEDSWPELQQWIRQWRRWKGMQADDTRTYPAVAHTTAAIVTYMRRFQRWKDRVLRDEDGPFGNVTSYWYRHEFQKRGAVHTHAALWCSPGSARDDAIRAEMPRCDDVPPHLADFYDHLRNWTFRTQRHAQCRPERCFTGPRGRRLKKCKYGFPFEKESLRKLDDSNVRMLYPRRENEDSLIVEHNLMSKILFGAHVCDKHITSDGWEMYLAKYMSKPEPSFALRAPGTRLSPADAYSKHRVVGRMEVEMQLLGFAMTGSSHPVRWLPSPLNSHVLKKPWRLWDADDEESGVCPNLWERYLQRPSQLVAFTYPDVARNFHWVGSSRSTLASTRATELPGLPGVWFPRDTPCDDGTGIWRVRPVLAIPKWKYVVPSDDVRTEEYYLQKLTLNVPYTFDDVQANGMLSAANTSRSYIEEAVLRLPESHMLDMHEIVRDATVRRISFDRIREWMQFFALQDWIDLDEGLDLVNSNEQAVLETEQAAFHMADGHLVDEPPDSAAFDAPSRYRDWESLTPHFTDSQSKAFAAIKRRLTSNSAQLLGCIIGPAGTGKSYLLEAIISLLIKNLGLTVSPMAPTGVAAWLIGGATIHHRLELNPSLTSFMGRDSQAWQKLSTADVLVIDELSMMSADILDRINAACRKVATHEQARLPFGGKHVILLGDPAQLPPVGPARFVYDHPLFRKFEMLVLHDIKRQDHPRFLDVLANARAGTITPRDRAFLDGFKANVEDVDPLTTTIVVPTIKERDKYNTLQFERISHGKDVVQTDAVDKSKNGLSLQPGYVNNFMARTATSGAWPPSLRLCVGCRVMLLCNLNVPLGWVNGTIATATKILPEVVFVTNPQTGATLPLNKRSQTLRTFNGDAEIVRTQFPLIPAYAVTIHKVQGQTLDRVALALEKCFCDGQAYVALSRVCDPANMQILDIRDKAFKQSAAINNLLKWLDGMDRLIPGTHPTVPFPDFHNSATKRART